jgi:SAM-dependent methyltransferase
VTDEVLFDRADEYDAMLQKGLDLTGESKHYYREGRLELLGAMLTDRQRPERILDFGCGTGDTTVALARRFRGAEVLGMDTAPDALRLARARHSSAGVAFIGPDGLPHAGAFDLCYTNGVFHHIPPRHRAEALAAIRAVLHPHGLVALFENNPWNVGTRLVMRRIPFDRAARALSPRVARSLVQRNGFRLTADPQYLFFFPHALRGLRPLEPRLRRWPLGGQYLILAELEEGVR